MPRFGILPATASQQLHKVIQAGNQSFKPLPSPTGKPPYRLSLANILGHSSLTTQDRVVYVLGDSGGVKDPNPQKAVVSALVGDLSQYIGRAYPVAYHVGDVVYFNGDENEYSPQFYEPYAHFNAPIVAIPGNHDGDNTDDESVPSLTAFVNNFCAESPRMNPSAGDDNRDAMIQPNVYWTLEDDYFTIIGLYTNVPAGGSIHQDQLTWFKNELVSAPNDRPLIVALHHPPVSADAHHGGSAKMLGMLDAAFAQVNIWPRLVLSGHVHNYQRFTRTVNGHTIPYVTIGNSGYHNLHRMAFDAHRDMKLSDEFTLNAFCDDQWGFLRLIFNGQTIGASFIAVDYYGHAYMSYDTFTA